MTIEHASTLLLGGTALALAFALLRLSFWLRDRHGRHRHLPGDFAGEPQEGAKVVPLVLANVGSGTGLTIDLASSDLQPEARRAASHLAASSWAVRGSRHSPSYRQPAAADPEPP